MASDAAHERDTLARAPEALVVGLARTGDRAAFAELVRRRQSWIRNLMRRATGGDTVLADDLAQQVFLQAWRNIGKLREPQGFGAWLKLLAINTWLQHLRRHDALRESEEVDETLAAPPAAAPGLARDLDTALAKLPAAMRLCVVLAYHAGLTHPEIAEATGLAEGTVKSHIRRGAECLRARLADYGDAKTTETET